MPSDNRGIAMGMNYTVDEDKKKQLAALAVAKSGLVIHPDGEEARIFNLEDSKLSLLETSLKALGLEKATGNGATLSNRMDFNIQYVPDGKNVIHIHSGGIGKLIDAQVPDTGLQILSGSHVSKIRNVTIA